MLTVAPTMATLVWLSVTCPAMIAGDGVGVAVGDEVTVGIGNGEPVAVGEGEDEAVGNGLAVGRRVGLGLGFAVGVEVFAGLASCRASVKRLSERGAGR